MVMQSSGPSSGLAIADGQSRASNAYDDLGDVKADQSVALDSAALTCTIAGSLTI
jgi:hypothetical protein